MNIELGISVNEYPSVFENEIMQSLVVVYVNKFSILSWPDKSRWKQGGQTLSFAIPTAIDPPLVSANHSKSPRCCVEIQIPHGCSHFFPGRYFTHQRPSIAPQSLPVLTGGCPIIALSITSSSVTRPFLFSIIAVPSASPQTPHHSSSLCTAHIRRGAPRFCETVDVAGAEDADADAGDEDEDEDEAILA